jgi:hypothetical protein
MSATHPDVRAASAATETGVYVYGVVRESAATPEARGIGEARVERVGYRDVAALTSTVGSLPIRAKRRELMAHSNVLTAAVANGAVLPMRFGTIFERGEDVAARFLEPRYGELGRLLDEFEAVVELRVKASYRTDAVLEEIVRTNPRVAGLREATSGRPEAETRALRVELGTAVAAELEARKAEDAREIVERLRGLADAVELSETGIDEQVLRASFLVRRARLGAFDAAMDDIARRHAEHIQFGYIGPLPPHSFVALEAR